MWQLSHLMKHHFSRWRWRSLLIGFAIIMAAGCASQSYHQAKRNSSEFEAKIQPEPQVTESKTTTSDFVIIDQKLRSEVKKWEGTPHQMGGMTRRGIDCSGFVNRLYQDVFGRQIPRSTELLLKSGRSVGKEQLRAGDLLFFKSSYKKGHVGIYLSRAEFAHASSSNGVTISSLQNQYWRQTYWTARRYLNTP